MMSFFISNGQKLRLRNITQYYPFGDSITENNSTWSFVNRIKDKYGLTRNLRARGGEGFPYMTKRANQDFSGIGLCTSANGRNDTVNTAKALYGQWSTTLLLGVQFSNLIIPASSATRVGSWSAVDYTAFCSRRNDCQQSSTANNYLEYAVTGRHHVVAMIGSDNNTSTGTFRILGDGQVLYTIDASTNAISRTPTSSLPNPDLEEVGMGFLVFFPTAGAHTIRVEVVSGVVTADYCMTLKDPKDCNPAIITTEIATAAVSEYAPLRDNLRALVARFRSRGFPVAFARINNYWTNDAVQNPGPDFIHPDEFGHQCMATAFYANLRA